LLKSAQQMVITANDLKDAGISIPRWWRSGAIWKIHETNRAKLRKCGVLRQRRDDRSAVDERLMDPATRETLLRANGEAPVGLRVTTT